MTNKTPYQSTHTGAEIDAGIGLLDKNSATQGQVLTADGAGKASWQNAGGSSGGAIPVGRTVKIEGRGYGAQYELGYLGKLRNSLTHNGTTYNTDYGYNVIHFSDEQTFYIDNCAFCILEYTGNGGAITPYVNVQVEAVVNGVLESSYRKDFTGPAAVIINLLGNCGIVCGDDG